MRTLGSYTSHNSPYTPWRVTFRNYIYCTLHNYMTIKFSLTINSCRPIVPHHQLTCIDSEFHSTKEESCQLHKFTKVLGPVNWPQYMQGGDLSSFSQSFEIMLVKCS